jgi:hypothetical protein
MTPTDWQLLQAFACGFGGALIGSMAKTRKLQLPRVYAVRTATGEVIKGLDAGFLVSPLLGGILAMIVNGGPERAIGYGLATGYAGPAVLNALIDPFLRRLGIEPDGLANGNGNGVAGGLANGPVVPPLPGSGNPPPPQTNPAPRFRPPTGGRG